MVDSSPLTQFLKFNNFLWVCWFLGKNLSNFVPPAWKLNNPYYHTQDKSCISQVHTINTDYIWLVKFSTMPWRPNLPNNSKSTRSIWAFMVVLWKYNFGLRMVCWCDIGNMGELIFWILPKTDLKHIVLPRYFPIRHTVQRWAIYLNFLRLKLVGPT